MPVHAHPYLNKLEELNARAKRAEENEERMNKVVTPEEAKNSPERKVSLDRVRRQVTYAMNEGRNSVVVHAVPGWECVVAEFSEHWVIYGDAPIHGTVNLRITPRGKQETKEVPTKQYPDNFKTCQDPVSSAQPHEVSVRCSLGGYSARSVTDSEYLGWWPSKDQADRACAEYIPKAAEKKEANVNSQVGMADSMPCTVTGAVYEHPYFGATYEECTLNRRRLWEGINWMREAAKVAVAKNDKQAAEIARLSAALAASVEERKSTLCHLERRHANQQASLVTYQGIERQLKAELKKVKEDPASRGPDENLNWVYDTRKVLGASLNEHAVDAAKRVMKERNENASKVVAVATTLGCETFEVAQAATDLVAMNARLGVLLDKERASRAAGVVSHIREALHCKDGSDIVEYAKQYHREYCEMTEKLSRTEASERVSMQVVHHVRDALHITPGVHIPSQAANLYAELLRLRRSEDAVKGLKHSDWTTDEDGHEYNSLAYNSMARTAVEVIGTKDFASELINGSRYTASYMILKALHQMHGMRPGPMPAEERKKGGE